MLVMEPEWWTEYRDLGYGLDIREIVVRFLAGARDVRVSVLQIVQSGCGVYLAAYCMDARSCVTGDKVAGA
jgi:hypothetical protein